MPPGGGGYGPPPGGPPGGYPPPQGGGYGAPPGPPGAPGMPPVGPARPAQPKKGPPVALFAGIGCGLFAVLAVIALVIGVAVGGDDDDTTASSSDDDGSSSSSSGDDKPEDTGDVMVGARFKRIPSTNIEVPIPPGWREDKRSLYTFALSDDGDALLAFTTVSSLGEFNGRLQHAERVFQIEGCAMEPATRIRIGPNKLRSRLKEGDCTFNGVRARVATVLVESGRRALPLVIYAVDKKASARTTKQAQQTIAGMRKR